MSCIRMASIGLVALGFLAGCCSSDRPLWNRMRPMRSTPCPEAPCADGPVLEGCAEPEPPMMPPTYIPPQPAPLPPAGVMEEGGSESVVQPRRLIPRPRAQDMPYTP